MVQPLPVELVAIQESVSKSERRAHTTCLLATDFLALDRCRFDASLRAVGCINLTLKEILPARSGVTHSQSTAAAKRIG